MRALELVPPRVALLVASGGALIVLAVRGFGIEMLALAVAIPILLAIVQRPQRGVLLLVLLVPFHGLLTLTAAPGVVIAWKEVLAGIVLVATFVCPVSARALKGGVRPGWFPALLALVAIGFVSAAVTHDLAAAIGLKIDFYWLLLGLAVWRCPFNDVERDRLVSIFMGTGFVCAVIGLAQQFVGPAALNRLGYEYNTTIRMAGSFFRSFSTFAEPFAFAFYMMLVLLVATPVALSAPARLRNRLFLLALPIYALGLLSTVVRGGFLGVGAGFAYLGFTRYRGLLLGLPLAIVAIVVFGVLGGSVSASFTSGSSFVQRQTGWQQNFVELPRHPFGVGIGTTGAAAATAAGVAQPSNLYNPDNYYFKTVYELGVLGLWMLLLLLVTLFVTTRRTAERAKPRDGPLLDGITALALGAAAACFVANFFDSFPTDVGFAVLFGVAASIGARVWLDESEATEDLGVAV